MTERREGGKFKANQVTREERAVDEFVMFLPSTLRAFPVRLAFNGQGYRVLQGLHPRISESLLTHFYQHSHWSAKDQPLQGQAGDRSAAVEVASAELLQFLNTRPLTTNGRQQRKQPTTFKPLTASRIAASVNPLLRLRQPKASSLFHLFQNRYACRDIVNRLGQVRLEAIAMRRSSTESSS